MQPPPREPPLRLKGLDLRLRIAGTVHYRIAASFVGLGLLSLVSCGGMAVVSKSVVNHAYEGRVKRLVVYSHVFAGLPEHMSSSFDMQFTADMARCGVAVQIVDVGDVELNAQQKLVQALRATQPDTVLFGNWSRRQTQGNVIIQGQDAIFTLSQVHRNNDPVPSLGEVWKAEITQNFGNRFSNLDDGQQLAIRLADQLASDRMIIGCPPRPPGKD